MLLCVVEGMIMLFVQSLHHLSRVRESYPRAFWNVPGMFGKKPGSLLLGQRELGSGREERGVASLALGDFCVPLTFCRGMGVGGQRTTAFPSGSDVMYTCLN